MHNCKKSDLFWPIIVIIIWFYYSLKNIFQIDILSDFDLSFSQIWPVAILTYGIYVLIKNYKKR